MQQPAAPWWQPILEWIASNTVLFGVFALLWKAIDKGVEIWKEARDERINQLIEKQLKNVVTPEIKKLSESIDDLKEAIWDLKKP